MNLATEIKHAGKSVKVFYDEDPVNPRTDYDNLTEIAHWHRRYDFGRKLDERTSELAMRLEAEEKGDPILAILPLYLYDHSGLTINNGGFGCGWDSGQVGWIYVTQSGAEKMGCADWSVEKLLEGIRGDTKTYDYYLTGQVYGYVVYGRDGDELDSCWGFLGDIEDCLSEGKSAAEGCEDPAVLRDVEEMASRVTYASVG